MKVNKIIESKNPAVIKELFSFNRNNTEEEILVKFKLWTRYFFGKYFKHSDAPFHKEINKYNLRVYRGELKSFVDIVFRGGGKSSLTKLFVAYTIGNDKDHSRRYYKVLTKDIKNSKQIVTDVYNMLIEKKHSLVYPEIFKKTNAKREETMSSFTTATGLKLTAVSVGTDQRGQLQEQSRPDFEWFEDFETRKTLRSAVETNAIWDNMEEARTGLSKDGGCVYTANYISEAGNVHKLIQKESEGKKVLIIPILKEDKPTWDYYTLEDIEQMKEEDDDFAGERMCNPAAGKDVLFDRDKVNTQVPKEPVRETAGLKIFREFDPQHRTGSGHDVAGGVGLDSSTSVFIDFDLVPAQVIGTFKSNTIKPEAFGYEIKRETDIFGGCLAGIENNKFDATIQIAKQENVNLYKTEGKARALNVVPTSYGWNTNTLTKPKMLLALSKAVEDGLIELNDKDLIAEVRGYTRNDLIDNVKDPRLTTRHFDLLIACSIAWMMKDHVKINKISKMPQEQLDW